MTSDTSLNSPPNAETASQRSEQGSFAGVKDQLDDLTRSSVTDFKDSFVAVASDAVTGVKETVAEGIPIATEALQSAQDRVRSLVKGVEETVEPASEEQEAMAKDAEHIDQMDTEQICDFLRDKHRSTKPPPSTS
ncbi:hypothetical protein N7448_002445 [Penicillium atrosanguineum]|uniref:Uncharacterized protein n=1 Tax=Penicillium atrosanguineum TaxID=1132637 RepID=A0A9W9HDY7_9EURO|nr:uncharacterized protein N7443_005846 [Penicillium atrosanguineum]KAJ5128728.1 hypothetical protein N7526_006894 [Penicillium atrosanguineum]KAJ5145053.1 hypothetical protein N7448_002445 [Penicillium atrosanguineum]KAJ5300844.1 hypothetical protein N7443_005846 [Penicillium atrosanguineum]KAJ5311488.1 hypothetical protein N7476_007348 [Penicillium atrosanguineum]